MTDDAELLTFFAHSHLPPKLAAVSAPFADLAHSLVRTQDPGRQRTIALEYLLIAKDAAVRSALTTRARETTP